MIHYLKLEQVLYIHNKMIEIYGGSKEIRSIPLLESALVRPQLSAFGEDAYPTLFMKVAALFHSMIKNHPFLDGNKRTAFGCLHLMLLINDYELTSSMENEIEMSLRAATDDLTIEEISEWIKSNSKKLH